LRGFRTGDCFEVFSQAADHSYREGDLNQLLADEVRARELENSLPLRHITCARAVIALAAPPLSRPSRREISPSSACLR
jgi:hypothetical protein